MGEHEVGNAMGINTWAAFVIHNHVRWNPHAFAFLHYWGIGSTTDLAKGLKAVLDTQKK